MQIFWQNISPADTLKKKTNTLNYNEFTTYLEEGKIEELTITPSSGSGVYNLTGKLEDYDANETFELIVPLSDSVIEDILIVSKEQNLNVETKQTATVTYNGFSTTFDFTLNLGYEEDLSGEVKEYLFEAEYAEIKEGAYAGVEVCSGQTREDGSQELCVKGLYQTEEGGWVRWTINSDKATQAELTFQISLQTNFDGDLDRYSNLLVNDCRVITDIEVIGTNTGWWDWVDRKVSTKIHLKEGENHIDFKTNQIAGTDVTTCGGLNLNWLKAETNANLTWNPNLEVDPAAPQA